MYYCETYTTIHIRDFRFFPFLFGVLQNVTKVLHLEWNVPGTAFIFLINASLLTLCSAKKRKQFPSFSVEKSSLSKIIWKHIINSFSSLFKHAILFFPPKLPINYINYAKAIGKAYMYLRINNKILKNHSAHKWK